jgi:hypothetical protein
MTKVQDFILLYQLPEERFLPVLNFEGRFWISDHGRIISYNGRYDGARFMSPHLDSLGYYNTQLRKSPLSIKKRVHQLVGEHYCEMIPTPGERMVWNHKDGNKLNNHYTNLEYVTAGQNMSHAVSMGLHNLKGENHPHRKLTEKQVLEIRQLRKDGLLYKDIASMYDIGRRQASDIARRINWGWLS